MEYSGRKNILKRREYSEKKDNWVSSLSIIFPPFPSLWNFPLPVLGYQEVVEHVHSRPVSSFWSLGFRYLFLFFLKRERERKRERIRIERERKRVRAGWGDRVHCTKSSSAVLRGRELRVQKKLGGGSTSISFLLSLFLLSLLRIFSFFL